MGDYSNICELRGRAVEGKGCTLIPGLKYCGKRSLRSSLGSQHRDCTTADVDTLSDPAAQTALQRWIPVDANTGWIMAPNQYGGGNGYKIIKGVGGSSGTDLGTPWPAWRQSAEYMYTNLTDNPTVATPIGVWTDDIGAQDTAMRALVNGPYGNSYHGLSTGTIAFTQILADGVPIDPTQPATAKQFSLFYQETPIWPSSETATITHTTVFLNTGQVTKTSRIVSASTFYEWYPDLNIGSGNFDEAFMGNDPASLIGYKADGDTGYFPGFSYVKTRNSTTGFAMLEFSDAVSKPQFSRIEIRPAGAVGSRLKVYFRLTGIPGDSTVTGTTTYLKETPGASVFGPNLVLNPVPTTDLTNWVQTAGVTTFAAGKFHQVSATGGVQNKLTQLIAALDTNSYYVFGFSNALTGNAPSVATIISALGILTNGSTGGANAVPPTNTAGRTLVGFKPTQAQLQVILGTQATAAAGDSVLDWSNILLTKMV